jgi:hypothetical protein
MGPDPTALQTRITDSSTHDPDYVQGLVRSFPGWTPRDSKFFLERDLGAGPPDRIVLLNGGRMVCGAGLVYRPLRTAAGEDLVAMVMSGAWTDPAWRDRGLFTRLIVESLARGYVRGAAVYFGFTPQDRATYRVLQRLGAVVVGTVYCTWAGTAAATRAQVRTVPVTRALKSRLAAACEVERQHATHFTYGNVGIWTGQFLERPQPVSVLATGDGSYAIVESVDNTERVQLFLGSGSERGAAIAALCAYAADRGRALFHFAPAAETALLQSANFDVQQGALMLLPTGSAGASADASARDRLPDQSAPLAWALQPWSLASGDRC